MAASQSHNHDDISESTSSSAHPFISKNRGISIAAMSDINGKAPVLPTNGAGTPHHDPIIKVQPPRREDLQPSYARIIQPDDADADTNGWYGSMVSADMSSVYLYPSLTSLDQRSW